MFLSIIYCSRVVWAMLKNIGRADGAVDDKTKSRQERTKMVVLVVSSVQFRSKRASQ